MLKICPCIDDLFGQEKKTNTPARKKNYIPPAINSEWCVLLFRFLYGNKTNHFNEWAEIGVVFGKSDLNFKMR